MDSTPTVPHRGKYITWGVWTLIALTITGVVTAACAMGTSYLLWTQTNLSQVPINIGTVVCGLLVVILLATGGSLSVRTRTAMILVRRGVYEIGAPMLAGGAMGALAMMRDVGVETAMWRGAAIVCGPTMFGVWAVVVLAMKRAKSLGTDLLKVGGGGYDVLVTHVPLTPTQTVESILPEMETLITDLSGRPRSRPMSRYQSVASDGSIDIVFADEMALKRLPFKSRVQAAQAAYRFQLVPAGESITRLAFSVIYPMDLWLWRRVGAAHVAAAVAMRVESSTAQALTDQDLRWRNERLQRLAAQAELKALQAQVEPHFLFNTLASVRRLVSTEPLAAEVMLDNLVTYLRNAMPDMRATLSTVEREVKLTNSYLAIMQVRMGANRLAFSTDVPAELLVHPFPPAMLISLVENAIKHGLQQAERGGRVEVSLRQVGDRLVATVSDDGVGISSQSGTGVGLSNIRQRLEALYGKEARLSAASRPTGGFEARIEIPFGGSNG